MAANPISLVIIAIGALIGGLVLLYEHSKTFRDIVQAVGRAGAAAFEWIVGAVKSVIHWIGGAIGTINKDWPGVRAVLMAPFNAVKAIVLWIWSKIQDIISAAGKVANALNPLPGPLGGGTSITGTGTPAQRHQAQVKLHQQGGFAGAPAAPPAPSAAPHAGASRPGHRNVLIGGDIILHVDGKEIARVTRRQLQNAMMAGA